MTKQIAVLGTGQMGSGIAGRLLDAGYRVRVYNRTAARAEPLLARGALLSRSPAEAAAGADAVFSMVGDDPASEAMWCGPDGALSAPAKPGRLAIECSTLSHDWVNDLAARARSAGYAYLDCPVTGLPDAAAAGKLVLFLGGSAATIAAAQPFLDTISIGQMHFGDIGAGTAYKLIVNLMGSVQLAAAAEGLAVAERAGLDMTLVARALASGGCGSPQVARNAALMIAGDHTNNIAFSARWRLKDTDYGLRFARKMGLNPGIGAATLNVFQELVDAGFSAQAETKIIDILRK
ncbi:MAG: NAD(P)-dependent oxidoreductase [Rhodospirillales bacterium]|nr:NAD(P)-dependent oxidoreductase [Rhodospirillales bacterium]